MKIIFSRKGFDSSNGGYPSPIIDGQPVSLPIPEPNEEWKDKRRTTYGDLEAGKHGLGELVESVTKGKIKSTDYCHNDPMFEKGRCAFGQSGAAQTHLANNHIKKGDVFLFFGRFEKDGDKQAHHRIFGYLEIEKIDKLGKEPNESRRPVGFSKLHPHVIGSYHDNNTLYIGEGQVATRASDKLRLTHPNKTSRYWRVPNWLYMGELTYHNRDSWEEGSKVLASACIGQEFITDISGKDDAKKWLEEILSEIRSR